MQLSFWISWQQLLVDVKWCQCNGSEMGGKPLMAVTLLNGLIYWSQVFRCDLRCSKPHHLTVVLRSSVRFLQSTQPRGIRTPSDHRFWWSFQKNRTTPPKKMGQSEQHLLTVTGHPKSRNKNDRFSIVKVSIAVFQLGQAAPGADGNGEMVDLPWSTYPNLMGNMMSNDRMWMWGSGPSHMSKSTDKPRGLQWKSS